MKLHKEYKYTSENDKIGKLTRVQGFIIELLHIDPYNPLYFTGHTEMGTAGRTMFIQQARIFDTINQAEVVIRTVRDGNLEYQIHPCDIEYKLEDAKTYQKD